MNYYPYLKQLAERIISNNISESKLKYLISKLPGQLDSTIQEYDLTCLHLAAQRGNMLAIEILLRNGANINIQDNYGNTPLYYALCNCHLDVMNLLINNGANSSVKNNDGNTCLDIALYSDGKTLVHLFVQCDNFNWIKYLLNNGANVNAKDNKGITPLHIASIKGYLDVINLLLDHGANVNAQDNKGGAPLHIASVRGHLDVVNLLIKKGANVNVKDDDGDTPLYYAAYTGNTMMIETLLTNSKIIIDDKSKELVINLVDENKISWEVQEKIKITLAQEKVMGNNVVYSDKKLCIEGNLSLDNVDEEARVVAENPAAEIMDYYDVMFDYNQDTIEENYSIVKLLCNYFDCCN